MSTEDGITSIVLAKENSNHKLKGMITGIERIDFYSACKTCTSKLDSNNWCEKCKAHKTVLRRFILSIILDDSTAAIKITFFGDKAVNLVKLDENEFDVFSRLNTLELVDSESFAQKLAILNGKKIIVFVRIIKNEFTNLLEGNAYSFKII